jgi:hypothetical protein
MKLNHQGETPNSFSMSAIIGCVKPALRNSAKSSTMTCSQESRGRRLVLQASPNLPNR